MKDCKDCKYGIDYGDSVEFIWCERGKRRKTVTKTHTCKKWEEANYKLKEEIIKNMLGGGGE